MDISKKDSERITSLRFILMCLVVLFHAQSENDYTGNLKYVQCFFANWATSAVFIFFLISSYLLFLKNDKYLTVLKKKSKALLVPYLIWPASYLLIKILPKFFASLLFPGRLKNPWEFYTSDWNILDYIKFFTFWDDNFFNPFWPQFWFLRQLIIFIVISPLILFFARYFALEFFFILFIIILGICSEISDLIQYIFFRPLLFFYIGALCARYKFSFFEFADKFKWSFLIVCFIICFFTEYVFKLNNTGLFVLVYVFIRCLILLKLSKILIQKNSDETEGKLFLILKNLNKYSFFLFAIHIKILNPILSSIFRFLICIDTDIELLGYFFFVVIGNIIIAVFSGMIFNKLCPKLYSLYTGGR